MDFRKLLILAKSGSHSAINKLMQMYQSVLVKESIVNGTLDEDLYQEQCMILMVNCKMKLDT